jgi:helix-turn-helix protein
VLNTKMTGAASAHEELSALIDACPGRWWESLTADVLAIERSTPGVVFVGHVSGHRVQMRPRRLEALPLREVERTLGIHRRTLSTHLKAGTIRAIAFGGRLRVAQAEIDRVLREGLPSLDGRPARPTSQPRRRKLAAKTGVGAKIRAIKL